MALEEDVEVLTTQAKEVLIALGEVEEEADTSKIQELTDLGQTAVMRAALSLKERNLAEIHEELEQWITLTGEGGAYAKKSLPERRLLEALSEVDSSTLDELAERAGLSEEKTGISVGWAKRKGWAEFSTKDDKKLFKITEKGRSFLEKVGEDERLLKKIESAGSLLMNQIPSDLRETVEDLKDRGLIGIKDKTRYILSLTQRGKNALKMGLKAKEEISQLNHDLLVSGKWKEAKLRRYDVTAPGAPVHPGKPHPQQQLIDELRSILIRMGFKEIKSPYVETEFWNFDALFQAQNHPARDVHDSLSLSNPAKGKIPDEDLLRRVKKAHEEGVAGSKGWGYEFDEEISHRSVMCSQTTAASVRYLAKQPEPPVKVFCMQKVYRRERIDYMHLAEFPQVDGIVMAPGLTLRDMLGYLKQIILEMGIPKVRFRPGYFPYTEPSAEADGYFPEKDEWVELLGAGMFRPELLNPLGIKHPVLAWGIGFSRIAMIRLGIEDMRNLHNNDLEWLKKRPLV